jgi:hypothetical protein
MTDCLLFTEVTPVKDLGKATLRLPQDKEKKRDILSKERDQ